MNTLFLAVFVVMLIATFALSMQQREFNKGSVRIGTDIMLDVDVADTVVRHERGLSGRQYLDDDEGMLFLLGTKQRYTFWMKGMVMPIDILWIDEGKVVDISADVPVPDADGHLETYTPAVPVDTVLEVSAGFAELHGVTIGASVTYDIDR